MRPEQRPPPQKEQLTTVHQLESGTWLHLPVAYYQTCLLGMQFIIAWSIKMPSCSELIVRYHHIILMQWNDISSQQGLETNMHISLKVFEQDSNLIFHPSLPPKLHLIDPLSLNTQHHFLISYITSLTKADILGHSHRPSSKWLSDLSSPPLS